MEREAGQQKDQFYDHLVKLHMHNFKFHTILSELLKTQENLATTQTSSLY